MFLIQSLVDLGNLVRVWLTKLVVSNVSVFLMEFVVCHIRVDAFVRIIAMGAGLFCTLNPIFFTIPGPVMYTDCAKDVIRGLTRMMPGRINDN